MLDPFTKKRIIKIMEDYVETRIPKHIRDKLKLSYSIRGNNVTLIEERPAFKSDQWVQLNIAQFRLDQNKWKVYWQDSKNKWHFVDDIEPDEDFEKQLSVVDKDEREMFWG
ncbi:DUF3024 domain-containing protein [Paenibacillus abyssi]|uniref:DUF3024 domain-containing protein n=1 Tax=Paenibacillus abyssi TaxID=1340531 RepID=UPI004032D9BB